MLDGIEAHYRVIAESMASAIPEPWLSAKYEAIFFPGGSIYEAEYQREEDGVARGFQPADGGSRTFRKVRSMFKDAGKPLWGRACFELWPDGKFKMHWGYNDCDEQGFANYDEEAELERHLERHKRLTGA